MNTHKKPALLTPTEHLGKKSMLIILGITFSFYFSLSLLPYFFVDADIPILRADEIPVVGIFLMFVASYCSFYYVKKTRTFVSKAYFFVPAIVVLLIATLFYA